MKFEQLGPYRIVRTLGRGGMGTVYEGVHDASGERAAVKVLSAALAQEPGFRDRFEVEIETLRKLRHPNIVELRGFGRLDDLLYYVMELVEGTSLEEHLRQDRVFDWREVVPMVIDTCRGLRHAHDRGVIHRDIKPANLLLDPEGRIKLSDFGIAKLFGNAPVTAEGNLVGTAEYMSPEQTDGGPVTPRTDLYSLGGVVYALLAGHPPFIAKTLPEMLQMQRFDIPDPLGQHVKDLPEELAAIVGQLLEKDPASRIPSPLALIRRLEAMQEALSVVPETVTADPSEMLSADPSEMRDEGTGEFDFSADPQGVTRSAPNLRVPVETSPGESPVEQDEPEEKQEAKPAGKFTTVDEAPIETEPAPSPPMISVQVVALSAALIFIGLTALYLMRPPTAQDLFDRIPTQSDVEIESLVEAEDDVREFLVRFPDDPRCAQLKRLEEEIELYHLERRFQRRARGLASVEGLLPIERSYLEAINLMELDPEQSMLRLQALVDLYQSGTNPASTAGKCLELARRRLAQLRREIDGYSAEYARSLKERLDEADGLRPSDPESARAMYRAVVKLYDGKPWAREAVDRARKALTEEPGS